MRIEDRIILAELYSEQSLPLDRLPYTEEFNTLVAKFNAYRARAATHKEVWDSLILCRKSGKLPKKGV